jgi:D-alanyl-D-alanine carboxypeptidase (penicillin-binding protein 5/6)
MANPVFAEIVHTPETTLPYGAPLQSTNLLLGTAGVIGVKTGETDEAGGCAIIAFEREVAGRTIRVLSVVLGQPSKEEALEVSSDLMSTVADSVQDILVLPRGTVLSTLEAAWGETTHIVTGEDVRVLAWAGMPINAAPALEPANAPLPAGEQVGTLTLEVGERQLSVPLETAGPVAAPGRLWRIFRLPERLTALVILELHLLAHALNRHEVWLLCG